MENKNFGLVEHRSETQRRRERRPSAGVGCRRIFAWLRRCGHRPVGEENGGREGFAPFAPRRTRGRVTGLYYINGPEVLPQPLSREDEGAAIADLETGGAAGEAARTLLIERNLRLVAFIARRYENSGVGIEDLISIGTLGLIKAVGTFRSDKNIKLATYASRCIENEILMHLRKVGGRQEVSIDEPLNTDWDGNELLLSDVLGNDEESVIRELEEAEERIALRRAVANLPDRERFIIELRFGLNARREMTQNEVAELLGISQSYISRLEKKILKKLRAALEEP